VQRCLGSGLGRERVQLGPRAAVVAADEREPDSGVFRLLDFLPQHLLRRHRAERLAHGEDRCSKVFILLLLLLLLLLL
jgi:hypothetical protein